MGRLTTVLEALSSTLEAPHARSETMSVLERALRVSLAADRVQIHMHEGRPVAFTGPHQLTVPLRLDGRDVGMVIAELPASAPISDEAANALKVLAGPLAVALAWRQRNEDRTHLQQLARTDALTGISNRLAFDERIDAAWRRCAERGTTLPVALIDIDFFKIYNDMYGHVEGDECLRRIASLLARRRHADDAGFVALRWRRVCHSLRRCGRHACGSRGRRRRLPLGSGVDSA